MHPSSAHPGILLKPEFALHLTEKLLKIQMYPQVSTRCCPKNLFLVNFGSKNFKVFYFKWNLVRKCIQGSSFWIWQFSSQIPKLLILGKICPKTSKCFVSNETQYPRVFQGFNFEFSIFFSYILSPKPLFWANFVSKLKSALF